VRIFGDLGELDDDLRHGAVAIGNFDGVHRGHARIVERLLAAARRVGGLATVFTFDPHPVRLLRPAQAPPPLTWTDRKVELLGELGVDAMVAYPTDEALLALTAREFFDRIIVGRLAARALVEGPNFCFGHNREGTIETLHEFSQSSGLALEIVPPVELDGQLVSSSRVRQLVAAGDVGAARRLLTQPYRIRGMVTHGAARGAKLGFPTANLDAIDTLLPAVGVYAGWAWTGGERHAAAINIGPTPTFGERSLKVEVHLLDFHQTIYHQPLEVDFLARVRDVQTFAGPAELQAQLQRDVATTRRIVAEN